MWTTNKLVVLSTFTWLIGLLVVACGCGGDGIDRCVVQGTVTFDDQPIENGEIRFIPESGPVSGAPIVNGEFRIDHLGGVPVGKHTVKITAYSLDEEKMQTDERDIAELTSGTEYQYLPSEYNDASTLMREVDGSANPLTLNFDL